MVTIKLGSLFDGIGGFPLAAQLNNIETVWASEIENIPIKITKEKFANMRHYGDIARIKGYEIEPVDIISFGSPCNNLSILGNKRGLEGEQSKLFLEATRIIHEMREKTNGEYPRYILWENVTGAFSSNKGTDFKRVIEEITQTNIPMPKSTKWAKSGMVGNERFSLAWRTFDAQYWGVPQHRERIFLVCDYRGQTAPEILFERKRVPGDTGQSDQEKLKNTTRLQGSFTNTIQTAGGKNVTSTLFAAYGTKWNSNSGAYTGNHFVIDDKQGERLIRRLTPLECERLMGFPDGWTYGYKDTPRYKALGNSVVINIVDWIFSRMIKAR